MVATSITATASATAALPRRTRITGCSSCLRAFVVGFLTLPARGFVLQLFVEPLREGREVVEDRRRIHLAFTGHRLERVRPRLRHTHLQHRVQLPSSFLALVRRAAVKRRLAAGDLVERPMELELHDEREEVA